MWCYSNESSINYTNGNRPELHIIYSVFDIINIDITLTSTDYKQLSVVMGVYKAAV